MSKSIPVQLLDHLALPVTTTCILVRVQCVGAHAGVLLGFTNLDVDRDYDDGDGLLTYSSQYGFTPKRFAQTSSLGVDNTEYYGGIGDLSTITEQMIRAGVFRSARVTVYRVNYEDLTAGRHEVMAHGRGGRVKFTHKGWGVEFRSLSQWLKQIISQAYSITCRAKFGSTTGKWSCNKPMTWVPGTVTSVGAENDRIFDDTAALELAGYWDFGVIRWVNGLNAGMEMEIDVYNVGHFEMVLGMPYPIQVGDEYERRLDCTKEFEYCRDVHDNTDWFRGEHLMPTDMTSQIPGTEIERWP